MKTGLVLEGGAMQGIYSTGVLDVLMEKGIKFDGVIGVSAGALFGVNYLSGQNGRVIRYNKKFNKDRTYLGMLPLIKEGNVVNTEFAYEKVPKELDIFDDEAFKRATIPFYAVVTNIRTGQPEYIQIKSVFEQMDVLRASGSMPFLSQPVKLGEDYYLDGAVTDSLPYQKMLDLGFDRVVVISTKDASYKKKPISKSLCKMFYEKKYPKFEAKVRGRHSMYNKQMRVLNELVKQGRAKVIRPSVPLYVSKLERDEMKLETLYRLGRHDAYEFLKSYEW